MTVTESITLALPDEAATARLAEAVARRVRPGDAILLAGPYGAGKTAFARAFLRAATGDPQLIVPSPSFTLVQTYALPGGVEAWHYDLWRVAGADELAEPGCTRSMPCPLRRPRWGERGVRNGFRLERDMDQRLVVLGSRERSDVKNLGRTPRKDDPLTSACPHQASRRPPRRRLDYGCHHVLPSNCASRVEDASQSFASRPSDRTSNPFPSSADTAAAGTTSIVATT